MFALEFGEKNCCCCHRNRSTTTAAASSLTASVPSHSHVSATSRPRYYHVNPMPLACQLNVNARSYPIVATSWAPCVLTGLPHHHTDFWPVHPKHLDHPKIFQFNIFSPFSDWFTPSCVRFLTVLDVLEPITWSVFCDWTPKLLYCLLIVLKCGFLTALVIGFGRLQWLSMEETPKKENASGTPRLHLHRLVQVGPSPRVDDCSHSLRGQNDQHYVGHSLTTNPVWTTPILEEEFSPSTRFLVNRQIVLAG